MVSNVCVRVRFFSIPFDLNPLENALEKRRKKKYGCQSDFGRISSKWNDNCCYSIQIQLHCNIRDIITVIILHTCTCINADALTLTLKLLHRCVTRKRPYNRSLQRIRCFAFANVVGALVLSLYTKAIEIVNVIKVLSYRDK